jgi:hypothetical protein
MYEGDPRSNAHYARTPHSMCLCGYVVLVSSLNLTLLIYIHEKKEVVFIVCVESFKMGDEIASEQITILDQRSLRKTEALCSHTLTEIYEFLLQKCGDTTSDQSTIPHWSQGFHQGQDCTEGEEHSGGLRISTDNTLVAIIAAILEEDRCMT